MDWKKLGSELRAAALADHNGELPIVSEAYVFLLANPRAFLPGDNPTWPAGMPQEPNIELIAAYYEVKDKS